MKTSSLVFFGMLVLISCQKEVSGDMENENEDPPATNCRPVKMVQGTDPNDDTVFVINYDLLGMIENIVDTTNEDTMTAWYDADLQIMEIENPGSQPIEFFHNSKGRVTRITSSGNDVTFEYTADTILTKISKGTYSYFIPEFDANKNLTVLKEYLTSTGTLRATTEMVYSNIPNPFSQLTPFSFENHLGMDDVLPLTVWAGYPGKFLPQKYTEKQDGAPGYLSVELTYERDPVTKTVTRSVANYKDMPAGTSRGVATRQYFYECQ